MHRHLIQNAGVRPSQVRVLVNGSTNCPIIGEPTQDNILNTLDQFQVDPAMRRGFKLLVNFAGHGSRKHFMPFDDHQHLIGRGEFGSKLMQLAQEKTAQITFIVDCCKAATMISFVKKSQYLRRVRVLKMPLGKHTCDLSSKP